MISRQTFQQWQQAPIRAIPRTSPLTPADEQYLLEVLTECHTRLSSALQTSQRYPNLFDLTAGISDSLQSIAEAAAVVNDPQTYLE